MATHSCALELCDDLEGVIIRGHESLCQMLEGLGDFIIVSVSMGGGGLSLQSQGFIPVFPHLIGDQQGIDETQDCCREAQHLSDTTQMRRKGQITLTTSSVFISHYCSSLTM